MPIPMKILFLDDDMNRHKVFKRNSIGVDVDHVYSYAEAVEKLRTTRYDVAFLDHDLSWEAAMGNQPADEKTGYDVAMFIVRLPDDRRPHKVVVHSFNPLGASRMVAALKDAGIPTIREPFHGGIGVR